MIESPRPGSSGSSLPSERLSEVEYLRIAQERCKGKRWTIYVCAEPDGENCVSGTHPNICRHECAALDRFHESEGREPGPQVVKVEVAPVEEHDRAMAEADDWANSPDHPNWEAGWRAGHGRTKVYRVELAALREAAQAVVDARNAGRFSSNFREAFIRPLDAIDRLRAVLDASTTPSEET